MRRRRCPPQARLAAGVVIDNMGQLKTQQPRGFSGLLPRYAALILQYGNRYRQSPDEISTSATHSFRNEESEN